MVSTNILAEFQPDISTSRPNELLARHGKALLYDDNTILILNCLAHSESVYFDMSEERLTRPRKIPVNTIGSKLVGFFDRKVLYVFGDQKNTQGFDFVRESLLPVGGKIVSDLASASFGSTLLPVTHSTRSETTAYSLNPTGGFYMIGGRDKLTNEILKDVQFFNGYTWQDRPPMQIGCRDAAAVAVPKTEQIVVIGGFGWDKRVLRYKECDYVEVFDGQEWSYGPSLNVARQNHSAVVIGDSMVVVLGGVTAQQKPVTDIEVWNMDGTSGFVVLPSPKLPPSRCKAPFDAVVHRQQVVYLIGGVTSAIGKISFNIQALADFTSIFLPQSSSSSAAAVAAPAATRVDGDDRKPPATKKKKQKKKNAPAPRSVAHNNKNLALTSTAKILPDDNMISWLPDPPSLPEPPVATTLQFRHSAMSSYIECLETIQEKYRQTIDESTKKITKHYNQLRDQQIDLARFHGTSWLSDTERKIQEAKQDVQLQEEMFKTATSSASSISNFLRQNDQDEFYDDIPSQLRCPLTLDLMTDPVVAADGNTYERSALEDWFKNSKLQHEKNKKKFVPRSPLTGAELLNGDFVAVHVLRSMCQEYAKQMNHGGSAS